jgi:hypothetical protein
MAGAIFLMMKTRRSSRKPFAHISEEMRRISVLLEEEVQRWPDVAVHSMFGMRAVYRKDVIFALLPETKMINRPNAIVYKFADKAEAKREGKKWQLFDVEGESSIAEALQVLNDAYRKAKINPPQNKK